jgi:release factor glutamine methyltransferase
VETIASLLKKSITFLKEKGIDEERRTAELLLTHALRCNRIDLYLRFDKPLAEDELERYREYVKRRIQHEPTQYILGSTEFYGVELEVSPAALIPRPETEHLVSCTLDILNVDYPGQELRILDIGTGTGAIPIAVCSQNSDVRFTAIDKCQKALALAGRNAASHKLESRIEFAEVDILKQSSIADAPFQIVLSNPPYISDAEYQTLEPEVNEHEPAMALNDGGDGLNFYRRIADISQQLLMNDGQLLVEIGYGQADQVQDIFSRAGLASANSFKDYAGIERVIHVKKK